jgi:hypothetical protein
MQAHRFPLLRTHFVVIPFDAPLLPFAFGARLFPMDFLGLVVSAGFARVLLRCDSAVSASSGRSTLPHIKLLYERLITVLQRRCT